MRPHNDNNVYILGAGFSAEAGLPLISSFLARMRDAVDWLDKAGRVAEREAIERVLDFRHESAAAGYRINIDLDNIEHLFSLADAIPGTASSDDIRLAIAATIDFTTQTGRAPNGILHISEANGWPCTDSWRRSANYWQDGISPGFSRVDSSIYDYYAATLSGLASAKRESDKNVVITLNYDVVIEEALRKLDIPISYKLSGDGVEFDPDASIDESAADTMQILKLHGSVNWAQQTDGSVLVCRDYERVRTLNLIPLLLPPTWQKIAAESLVRVWNASVSAISRATRIVLIGFSIPPADQHFKYLLSLGLKGNSSLRLVRIVDPRAVALRAQYETVFRKDQFKYEIASISELETKAFFYNKDQLIALGRPLAHAGLNLVAPDIGCTIERKGFP